MKTAEPSASPNTVLENDEVDDTVFHDAQSGDEDSEEEGDTAATGEQQKKKKKKKKNKKKKSGAAAAAGAEGEGEEADASAPAAVADQEPAGQDGTAEPESNTQGLSKSQKKRLKLKMKKAAVAGENGEDEGSSEDPADSQQHALSAIRTGMEPASSDDVSSISSFPTSVPSSVPGSVPMSRKDSIVSMGSTDLSRKGSMVSVPTPRSGTSRRIEVNMGMDFEPEPSATTKLGEEMPYHDLHGPIMKVAMAKSEQKGEDKWVQMPTNTWTLNELGGERVWAHDCRVVVGLVYSKPGEEAFWSGLACFGP